MFTVGACPYRRTGAHFAGTRAKGRQSGHIWGDHRASGAGRTIVMAVPADFSRRRPQPPYLPPRGLSIRRTASDDAQPHRRSNPRSHMPLFDKRNSDSSEVAAPPAEDAALLDAYSRAVIDVVETRRARPWCGSTCVGRAAARAPPGRHRLRRDRVARRARAHQQPCGRRRRARPRHHGRRPQPHRPGGRRRSRHRPRAGADRREP